jgi:methylamine--corrinoid protein Co-methyltransferase
MRHRSRLIDVLARAEDGPIVDEVDFDRKLVAPAIKRLIEDYGLKFDRSQIVPSDDDLADRVFQAGFDLAVEIGMFCQSTSRRIVWSRRELEEGLRYCTAEVIMGKGNDAAIARARRPEDAGRVVVVGGAYGIPVPENLFVPVMLSFAKEDVVDVIENATLESVYGYPIKAGSPWEVLGGWREAELSMEVIHRAGRPGMCIGCVETSPTALAQISASSWGGFRPTDWHHVATISEFKTNYDLLSKVTHTIRIGGVMECYANPIYGGYVGGAEGVAIALVAAPILLNQINMGDTFGTRPDHPFLKCDTTPEILWALSVAFQGLSRNTDLLLASLTGPASGPGTKSMLYENAAFTIATTVSGQSLIEASHSAGGSVARHVSGLDARICGEVAHAVAGMGREQANELVQRLLAIYEPELVSQLIGKPFEEVYDVNDVEPTIEWQGMYDEVREDLLRMGLQVDRLVSHNQGLSPS